MIEERRNLRKRENLFSFGQGTLDYFCLPGRLRCFVNMRVKLDILQRLTNSWMGNLCMRVSYKKQELITLLGLGSSPIFMGSVLFIFLDFCMWRLFVVVLCLVPNIVYVSGLCILDFPCGFVRFYH
jgi:hypothetical protein